MAAKKTTTRPLISSHLGSLKRALLEGKYCAAFLAFLDDELPTKGGIYALYDGKGRLYYAGKASDLSRRLHQHLKDRHADGWVTMTLFFIPKTSDVPHLEGLLIAAARPPGNRQKPRIGQDLRRNLDRYLRADAGRQVRDAIYSERSKPADRLAVRRITAKRLHGVKQAQLALALGISQPRVSHLMAAGDMQRYIRESGKRDAVLNLFDRQGG